MTSTTLVLAGEFTYQHAGAVRDELPNHLIVLLYVDRQFEREPQPFQNPHLQSGPIPFKMESKYPSAIQQLLPHDSKLCIQAYVGTLNEQRVRCLQDCGVRHISLNVLNKHIGKPLQVPLLLKTTQEPQVKGSITITMHKMTFGNLQSLKFGPMTSSMNTKANLVPIQQAMEAYLRTFLEEQQQYEIVYTGTQNINCPLDPSEVTVANSQLMVPFPTYLQFEAPQIESDWWYAQLSILADRKGFPTAEAYARWYHMQQNQGLRASQAIQLIAQYVEQVPYVSDRSLGEPIEMFGDLLAMTSGDCEDGACAICQMYTSFTRQPPVHKEIPAIHEMYRDMGTILKRYTPIFSILGVTASHVERDTNGKLPDVSGAHAAVFFIPTDYFAQCVGNWSKKHPAAQRIMQLSANLERLMPGETLPVLVGEGTGILEPGAITDPHPEASRLLSKCKTLAGQCKKMLYNGPTGQPSSFYKVLVFGASVEAAQRGERTQTWRFAQMLPTGHYSKGIRFEQLMQRDPSICLVPFAGTAQGLSEQVMQQPLHSLSSEQLKTIAQTFKLSSVNTLFEETKGLTAIDALVELRGPSSRPAILAEAARVTQSLAMEEEFTQFQLQVMANVAKTRIPPPRFRGPPRGLTVVNHQVKNAYLEEFIYQAGGAGQTQHTDQVHIGLHPDQINRGFLQSIATFVQQNRQHIVGLSYTYEWHSAALENWRISFHFPSSS